MENQEVVTGQSYGSGKIKQIEPSGSTTFKISLGNSGIWCPLGNSDGSSNQNSDLSSSGSNEPRLTAVSRTSVESRTETVALTTLNTTPVARHVYTAPSKEALLHLVKCPAATDEEIFVMAYALR
jgi:hypothetical protein